MIALDLARPERAFIALCAAQILFWTMAPAFSHSAPPLDVVEMYAWGREGVVATFKHPNLPGFVLEATRVVTGVAGWPAYLVSQIFIVITFGAVFALGRDLMDAPRALAGALLLTGVYFFSWPTPEFNHNVAQMPLWALTAWMLWRATTRGDWLSWALLGAFGGFSLWAKYSSAILLVCAAIWILWDASARKRLMTPGPWLALVVFAAVAAPQVLWLVDNDFQPISYAARRAETAGIGDALAFFPTQAINHLPFAILLLAAGWFGKANTDALPPPERRALHFLLLIGLGPAVLTAVLGLFGAGLKSAWGAPMFNLSGLLVVALMANKFSAPRLKRLGIGAGVMIVLVSGLYFAHMRYGMAVTGEPLRGNWPQARLSTELEEVWAAETNGAPLRIVSGDIWTAGLVGMSDRDPPSVLINGDFAISPWVTPDELVRDGALIVWRAPMAAEFANPPLAEGRTIGRLRIPFRSAPNVAPLEVNYAIVPPA